MLVRRSDWALALEAFLFEAQNRKFHYGSWDCCLFVCDAIKVMTGTDPATPFRGRYDSRDEAERELLSFCGSRSVRAVAERVAATNAMTEIPVKFAGRGDVALVKRSRDYSLGLVDLSGRDLLIAGASGLARISQMRAVRAWKI